MTNVDISQLAIDRSSEDSGVRNRRNWLTRYLIPLSIMTGFTMLIVWAAWDQLVPPRDVKVIPVIATQSNELSEGTLLFNASGWIEPRPTAIRVAALAAGVVEQLLVVEDQKVEKGEPVAELIKEDAELAYKRSVADRQLAEAELQKASAGLIAAKTKLDQPVHLEAELAKSDAALAKIKTQSKNLKFETERAISRLDLAQRNHLRNQEAGSSVSQRELDETQTSLETGKAMVMELKERLTSLLNEERALTAQKTAMKTQLNLLADEIRAKDEAIASVNASHAKVAQKKIAEAEANLRLSRMTIRAPVEGRVYQLLGLPGAQIGGGIMTAMKTHDGRSVITMYQPHQLQIRVDVRFEDIPRVSLQQPVSINNPALKKPITGQVLFVSSEADIQKNTLQVKVSIDDPPDFFKPEMLVEVTFLAPKQDKLTAKTNTETKIFIPKKHIQDSETGPFVWIADRSARIAKRSFITTGSSNGPLVEITKGLNIDSRIISIGIENLRDGHRIRIVGEDDS